MTDQQQVSEAGTTQGVATPVPVRGDVIAAYESLLAQVPDVEEGAGMERILAQLAAATDVSQLDAPWRTADFEQLAEQVLVITGISKAPSDYAGSLAWFLVVDAYIEQTGEAVTATTGAQSIVAQLTKVWQLGGFPVRARVRIAERPTKSGYFPQHLEFLPRRAAATNGNGPAA